MSRNILILQDNLLSVCFVTFSPFLFFICCLLDEFGDLKSARAVGDVVSICCGGCDCLFVDNGQIHWVINRNKKTVQHNV